MCRNGHEIAEHGDESAPRLCSLISASLNTTRVAEDFGKITPLVSDHGAGPEMQMPANDHSRNPCTTGGFFMRRFNITFTRISIAVITSLLAIAPTVGEVAAQVPGRVG